MSRRPDDQPMAGIDALAALANALDPYLVRYKQHLKVVEEQGITPDSPEHPDKMVDTGRRVSSIRNHVGMSLSELAKAGGLEDPIQLVAFEGGMVPPSALPKGFAGRVASKLKSALSAQGPHHPTRS